MEASEDPHDSTPSASTATAPSGQTLTPAELENLRLLTELLVGGTLNGSEELLRQLRAWQAELDAADVFTIDGPTPASTRAQVLRHALVGWLFETQDQAARVAARSGRISRAALNLLYPWLRPLHKSRLLAPAWRQFDRLTERGEDVVAGWVRRGQREERRGRDLANMALRRTVDSNIEYLTSNTEVQELVQTQSTSLANEVVEEVRERTVSADNFLEALARSVLRRTPRAELPPPPDSVRARAAGLRDQFLKRKK